MCLFVNELCTCFLFMRACMYMRWCVYCASMETQKEKKKSFDFAFEFPQGNIYACLYCTNWIWKAQVHFCCWKAPSIPSFYVNILLHNFNACMLIDANENLYLEYKIDQ
ncbi:Hypothetical predicted protein [Octopus vulgaris]|uniref:Uncharacterized protein n=1 Tax=Octopus vulgaris TaxID=6645 RepID=A0AA36BLN9_OCTVU|nr:Hypothetical predicted protein [Octopus vulgaris]